MNPIHFSSQVQTFCIKGFENYNIDIDGNIYNSRNKKLKSRLDTSGYLYVRLSKNNKITYFSIHRLLSLTFIPNPENKEQVNHINGIKTDNRLENLEWSTRSENIKHSYKLGLNKGSMFGKFGSLHNQSKKTICIETGVIYDSLKEASEKTGINRKSISAICCGGYGRSKTAGGFTWRYLNA